MSARVIDGKAVAETLRQRIAEAVASFPAEPCLAVVLVGDDPASHVYVRNKGIATRAAGMRSLEHRLPATASEADVLGVVAALNADPEVDGVLVQMPLPAHVSSARVIAAVDPAKDVDGLTETNAGRLLLGAQGLVPCTPQGCVMLARKALTTLAGLNAVVLGRSILVGKPLAMLLLAENCTVTMAHSRSRDLAGICRSADVLCAAVGKPGLVRGDWVKEGACVIDVGINRIEKDGKARLVGDVDYEPASRRAGAITPVPGGGGPMTIACLLKNTLIAAARRRGLPAPAL